MFSLFHRRTRRPVSRHRRARPCLEPLEDRSLPAAAYFQTNLVSDLPGAAAVTDPNLRNPWGVAINPAGDFWVSNAASGTVTLYRGDVNGMALAQDVPVITVPPAPGKSQGAPSGQVFNPTNNFAVNGTPALFIFAGLDGTLSAVSPNFYTGAPSSQAQLMVNATGAVYTGLALASNGSGNFLFAANAAAGTIDVYDRSFRTAFLPGRFTDPTLPANLTPFNVTALGGVLYVTYNSKLNRFQGGVVDKFDTNGNFLGRFADGTNLQAPWGVVMAPASFGAFGGDLLVGNFGDGHINAYNPTTGAFLGQLPGQDGQPLVIERLWQLTFGGGAAAGDPARLYFSSGLNQEKDGLFGSLRPMSADERFVAQAYHDLLHRPVDPVGLAFWVGTINQGATHQQVAAGITQSPEYHAVELHDLYAKLLHRAVDPAGSSFFMPLLASGATVEQVAALIAGSQEYFLNRGGGTTAGFLNALYQDGLARTPDAVGRAVFTGALQAGATRIDVAAVIFASDEFKAGLVQFLYPTFLHRSADKVGLAFFFNALRVGARDEDVIAVLVGSAEYSAAL
jgi:uncharacterized protein (TIGR03118 family)